MSDQRGVRAALPHARNGCSREARRRAHGAIRRGPLIALAIAGVATALYFTRSEPPAPPPLEASVVAFEVIREPDASGAPPVRESLSVAVRFANPRRAPAAIALARVIVSRDEGLSDPRSWSTTENRDAMLRDIALPANGSLDHTFVIPWTGRLETRYFPDGANIYLGLEVRVGAPTGETRAIAERLGHVVQRAGAIVNSQSEPLTLAIPGA
ncbi:MAG TPA: hypothetical protein VEC18_03170 [Myxococcota bacterium]|nr:hypothetical protein [Myxococcota bacterium]